MGIAFAIPIDEAIRVSEQLRTTGRVTRGRIGVQIDQVTKEVAEAIGLGRPQGALVRGVEVGAPAERAGVEAGDIITRIDGKAIEKSTDLPRMIGNLKPGTRSTLTVFRRGATRELAVTIGEFEPEKPVARREREREEKPRTAAASALGLTVTDLTDAQKRDLKLKGGVRVEAAVEAAARAGLREGDVILALANVEVGNLREFETQLAKLEKGRPVNVLFRRGEWAQYAVIRPPR
jgi:serine protease Do